MYHTLVIMDKDAKLFSITEIDNFTYAKVKNKETFSSAVHDRQKESAEESRNK